MEEEQMTTKAEITITPEAVRIYGHCRTHDGCTTLTALVNAMIAAMEEATPGGASYAVTPRKAPEPSFFVLYKIGTSWAEALLYKAFEAALRQAAEAYPEDMSIIDKC